MFWCMIDYILREPARVKLLKFYESFLSEKIRPIKSLAIRRLRSKCVAGLANCTKVSHYASTTDLHTARSTMLFNLYIYITFAF